MPTANWVVGSCAHNQVGYTESAGNNTKYGRWYGMNYQPWCDIFVSYIGNKAGMQSEIGKFALCSAHYNWFKNRGRSGSAARCGAIAFFDFGGGRIRHVGFVVSQTSTTIATIEGNTRPSGESKDGVFHRTRQKSMVAGYGYPRYSNPTRRTA